MFHFFKSKRKGYINVRKYGAKGDGTTDDTIAIQAAATAAKTKGKTLYIPSGTYLVDGELKIYTDTICIGTLEVANGSETIIYIDRSVSGTTIDAATLSGLTRGSDNIGLSGYDGGTVVMKSTEELIKRYDSGWVDPYLKNDTCAVVSASAISPALDCTYTNTAALTVTAYPYEKPITIDGLKVNVTGDTESTDIVVKCRRSNVTLDDFTFTNESETACPSMAIQIYDCVNVTVNTPDITGVFGTDDRYGLEYEYMSGLTVNGGTVGSASARPKHGVVGHGKNIHVNAGTYYGSESAVDAHWGNGLLVENATLDANSAVTFAGTDVTVRNCAVANAYQILALRQDTPEIMGDVVVEDITFTSPKADWGTFCYRAIYNETDELDFGHVLSGPDSMVFDDITIDVAAGWEVFYGEIYPDYASLYTGKITATDISLVDDGNLWTIWSGNY